MNPDLSKIIKDYTKAVIKANPEDINEFSWLYFKDKVEKDAAVNQAVAGKCKIYKIYHYLSYSYFIFLMSYLLIFFHLFIYSCYHFLCAFASVAEEG